MQKILARIEKKEQQILKAETTLKKYKDELKSLNDEKEKKELADIIKIIKDSDMSASELQVLLNKESRDINEN